MNTGRPRRAVRPHLDSILVKLWRAHVERMLARERGYSTEQADAKIRHLSTEAQIQGLTPIELKIKLKEMDDQLSSERFRRPVQNGSSMKKRTSKRSGMKANVDRRDLAATVKAFPEGATIDEGRMTISFTLDQEEGEPLDCEFRFKFDVCGLCGGKGTHVNPSIDAHGITSEEWEQDWDEDSRETYMSGGYDVSCYECGGQRVVPVIDEAKADKKCLDAFHAWQEEQEEYARITRSERDYGA